MELRETNEPNSRVIMNEVRTEGYASVFVPNVETVRKVVIMSVPEIGEVSYGCFVQPPTKQVCNEVTQYKDTEKTRTETRYCSAWNKLGGKC